MEHYDYAKAAYDAYCDKRGWKSVRGDQLPQFHDQSAELKEAWKAAAEAVLALDQADHCES